MQGGDKVDLGKIDKRQFDFQLPFNLVTLVAFQSVPLIDGND